MTTKTKPFSVQMKSGVDLNDGNFHYTMDLRQKLGWSRFRLAEEAGCSYTGIYRVETGHPLTRAMAFRLGRAFDVWPCCINRVGYIDDIGALMTDDDDVAIRKLAMKSGLTKWYDKKRAQWLERYKALEPEREVWRVAMQKQWDEAVKALGIEL